MVLKRIFGRRGSDCKDAVFSIPERQRAYAIGDIHGRLDLLDKLLSAIARDATGRDTVDTRLIFLGDLIDRGASSRGVVERAIQISDERPSTVFIKGNHEEVFIKAYDGDRQAMRLFDKIGGRQTLASYGVDGGVYENADIATLVDITRESVPSHHIDFLRGFLDLFKLGDYLFVHAGIRPGISLEEQKGSDLRWIRDEFLDSGEAHGAMIIHGHSIAPKVDERFNRIGIDTGAFQTGKLTALGLQYTERWYLST